MSSIEVYVTYLEKEGPFLKLWVQLNRSSAMFVEKLIRQYTDQFERGLFVTHPSALIVGGICCAKYVDGVYYRARIISLANVSEGEVYVQFCDFGNKEVVPVSNIRNVQVRAGDPQPPLVAVPDQATEFYLAGVLPPQGGEWEDSTVEHIRQKLGYEEFQGVIVGETARRKILALYSSGGIDISQVLIQEGLAVSITPSAQQMISQSLHTPQSVTHKVNVNAPTAPWQTFTPPPSINRVSNIRPNPAYQVETMRAARTNVNMKKNPVQQGSGRVFGVPVLEVNSEHLVYVSFVDDGPLAFSVQLKAFEDQLASMSNEINDNPPQPMLKPLLPGSVCLGRFSEDHLLCRAVVMSVMDDRCMIYYVDFGNSEVLPYSEIYEIPDKYMNLKSMALRYSLAGIRDIPLNDDLKDEFKKIVLDKLLKMKVVNPEGPPVKQYCELYVDGKSVKDLLLEKLRVQQLSKGYKKMPLPAVGLVENVYVSYVESVSSFYVQLEANVSGLTNIMNYLASYCNRTQVHGFSPTQLQVGMPCCALFANDGRWYRAKIKSIESNMVHVFYVDYGNSDTVPISSLCKIEPTLLSQPPEQAIHCILNGYEHCGAEDDLSATFELAVIEKLLSMKVLKHVPGGIVVDLYDTTVQPVKNISDLLTVAQTKAETAAAPAQLDSDWQESTSVGTAYGDSASGSTQREQYGGKGSKKRNKAGQPSDTAPYNRQRGSEDRNSPFRKSQRHDNSVSHWQNKGDRMSSESSDAGIAKGGNRFSSGTHRRDDHKSNSEAGRMGKEKEWDRNTKFGNKGGRYRGENTEAGGESQSDVFQSDRGTRQGNSRDQRRLPGNERDDDTENRWAPERGRDRPYDSNRRGNGGRFRGSDRETDGDSGRPSNLDTSRSYSDNRGGSYGNRERDGGNRRGGRFGDRDKGRDRNSDWNGGGRGGRRFGTAAENSSSEDSARSNNRKWEEKPDRNANKRDRWNSRDIGSSHGGYQNDMNTTAVAAEGDLWNDTETKPSVKTIPHIDVQLNTVHTMQLIYVVNPSEFCLQMTDDSKLNSMMEQIAVKYGDGGGTPLDNIKEGITCAALYSMDGSWNRAVIEAVYTDTVLCRFVDYGNSDEIPHSGLKILEKEFEILPAQAIKCVMLCAKPSGDSWSEEEILRFKEATDGKEINTKFVKRKSDVYEVILREAADSSKSINEDFGADPSELQKIEAGASVSSGICDNVDSICATFGDKYQLQNTLVGTKHDVLVSWFVNPENFYCQLISLQTELKNMMESIQTDYRKKKRQKINIVADTPVIARFKSDKVLYRAIVKELKGNAVVIQYVDFGNCDIADASDIWPLEKKYLSYPVYALQCCLKGVKPPNSEWKVSPLDVGKFFSEKQACTFHGQEDHKYSVTLENNGSSVAEALVTEGIAVKDEKAPPANNTSVNVEEELDLTLCQGQCLAAHVTYVCTLSKFFVHLNPARAVEIQACIENHMQQYSETAGKLPSSMLQQGKMCLATPDGVCWYRAIIMEIHQDHVTNNFIDFGDTAEVPMERMAPIPDDMVPCHRLAVECSVVGSNSNASSELDEQFKLEVEEQDVILHVDSVCEDRLCVRLFDIEGQRLELLKELYNDNLQEVEPVCPLPVLSSKMMVCVSHVEETAPFFWIQNVQDIAGLAQLLESWFDFYETKGNGKDLKDIKPGKLCAAKSGNDDNWYRARINSVDNENVSVNFIDYGNCEIVPISNIKALDDGFYSPHAMALRVRLPVNVLDNERTVTEFQNYTAEREFFAQLSRKTSEEDHWFIDLISEGKRVVDELSNLGLITEVEDSPFTGSFVVKSITKGVKASVYVTHVESPSSFWVQLGSNLDEIEKLRNMLQKHANTTDSMKTLPEIGMLCAAQYSEDASWYRAVVMDVEQTTVTVSFIDYGNTDKITLSSSGLKPLKSDLINLPAFGCKCSLDITPLPGETEWSEAAIKKFNEIVDETGGVMVAEVLKSAEVNVVTLYTDESNVSSILIDLKLAMSPSMKLENQSESLLETSEVDKSGDNGLQGKANDYDLVFVSHCNSPVDFWIQRKSAVGNLQYVTEKMENAANFSVFPDAREGALCAALFKDDGFWYRAEILSRNNDDMSVRFIDYGNTSTTDEVRVLPSDLLQMPGIAEHCSLTFPDEVNEWSENACSKFLSLVGEGETEFHMKLVKEGPVNVVSLDYNGEPVELILKQLYLKESELGKVSMVIDEPTDTAEVSEKKSFTVSGFEIPDGEIRQASQEIDPTVLSQNGSDNSQINEMPKVNESFEVEKSGDIGLQENANDDDLVFVSHCESPADFWIQRKSAIGNLQYVTEKMENAANFNVFPDAREGALCAALFKDDGFWYRAEVLSRNNDDMSVRFIDYGNTSTTDEVRVLPSDLLQMPGIAEHCSLTFPDEVNEWSENTCSEFLSLVKGGETEFHMKLVKEDLLNVVSLDYNGEPVELMLKQLYLKESDLEKVSTLKDQTSDTAEELVLQEHVNGTSVCDKTALHNTELQLVTLSADGVEIEEKLAASMVKNIPENKNFDIGRSEILDDETHIAHNEISTCISPQFKSGDSCENEASEIKTSSDFVSPDIKGIENSYRHPTNMQREGQNLELLQNEQKDDNQIKTKHRETLIQDLNVEVKVQSLSDQTKEDIVSQKVFEHPPADAGSPEALTNENKTVPDLLH
ncbi:tudor domain-containing 6-like isoform X2 [Schistocerca gregaria]|uniref:tudor domain-containing 6-like isoform X2 n=1 Tax=Schistocerca gregaria TaxID=7010 RepID=UPI00211DAD2E|nr:tudor domain-containing 6-like isoform X2 [Schistocerca gregaria]